MNENLNWMSEYVKSVPYNKRLYFFMKLFLFKWKGLKYKELYLILKKLHSETNNEDIAKSNATDEILNIYYFNNNAFPEIN